MSNIKQVERFGRVTGHTLRRSPQSNHFTGQFVIMKRTNRSGRLSYDDMNDQFQELVSDGHLQASGEIVYSLNKQRRWELPGLLKESICNDRGSHEDLDFKVLLVEQHVDSQGVFLGACTGLYESQTSQPERLPRKKYAHALDLHKRDQRRNSTEQEALHCQIAKLRCAKNRGGKKVNWRSVLDVAQQRIREEEQRREGEEEDIPQLRYEVGYCRPENKYPWRPEMKMNTVTSKRSMGTKHRHQDKTSFYLQDVYDTEDSIQDDIYEEVRSHSEFEGLPQEEPSDGYLITSESRPMPTLGEALSGLARKPKQGKKRRHKSSSSTTTTQSSTRSTTSNQATSEPVRVHDKGSAIYDPEAVIYKPLPKTPRGHHPGNAPAALADSGSAQDSDVSGVETLPSLCLRVDHASLQSSQLEAGFGMAYAEADCRPRRFAVQVGDGDTDRVSSPEESVYALFEASGNDATTIECTESEEDQSWQVVKKEVQLRMSVYGQKDRIIISSESLAAAFHSTGIFSIQEVMKHLERKLQQSSLCWTRVSGRGSVGCSRFRRLPSDIPTVRAELGWDCRISTADEAYREMTRGRQMTCQSGSSHDVQDPQVSSSTCGICYGGLSLREAGGGGVTAPCDGGVDATVLTTCGHAFCNQCWRQYLTSAVKQRAVNITCPEYRCKTLIDPVTSMAFLSPAQFHAYYRHSLDAALARSSHCHRCPNPLCGRVAQVNGGTEPPLSEGGGETRPSAVMVKCKCGWLWCTQCLEEGHWPASCQQAKEYRVLLKKKLGERETPIITHVRVKRCPRCKTRWEKNGGCPSMICGTCQFNFCWLCLNPFDKHNYSTCRKSVASHEAVYLDFRTRSKDYFLELAVEHHKHRVWGALRRDWLAVASLASRSAMVHVSAHMPGGIRSSCLMTSGIVIATAAATNYQPLTWAMTQEHLEMMSRRADESFDIVSFCHESNFVLEHMAYLLGCLPRRQRKTKWWRAMLKLKFIVQTLEETLCNLPNIKRSESEVVMDRLCAMMQVGKECLRKLARTMTSETPRWQGNKE